MGKLILIFLVIPAILLFGTNHDALFWIAIVNAAIFLIVGSIIPLWIAIPVLKMKNAMIKEAEKLDLSDEEMEAIIEHEIPVTEEDEKSVPKIFYKIGNATVVIGIGLLITGLLIRY